MIKGLVLEGGAMRGMYTAGVLDTFMKESIYFDKCVGVSAGAVFGCNYKSRQIGRTIRYNKKYCNDKRYCSLSSLVKTGDLYGASFCYDKLPNELDPFDYNAFKNNPMEFYAVVTNTHSGKSEYIKLNDGRGSEMDVLRASASMPIVSRCVRVGNNEYLDGGISDPIPVNFMLAQNVDKCVVILTQVREYKKSKNKLSLLLKMIYKDKRRAVVDAMLNRHNLYNNQLEEIRKLERKKKVFVIAPSRSLMVGKTEKDKEKLEDAYQLGVRDAYGSLEELRSYLNS